ncbi:MAG: tRNA threonylcarbamoyladenosine dehydratase [Eubacteriaceae bacterium]|nr:tRNA threonylcarbamoyladenosine dehydratase [Eubacteriaceae bacterium]
MNSIYTRSELLVGEQAVSRLRGAKVFVAGLGGVGSWAAEALARSGVGNITVCDADTIEITNVNRQIYALGSTAGQPKTKVAGARIHDINPQCLVKEIQARITADNVEEILGEERYDALIDAVDDTAAKTALAVYCEKAGIYEISAMGTGAKTDPTLLKVSDIYQTKICPLAKVMRRHLKDAGVKALDCVWSDESPVKIKDTIPSMVFVPAAAGLIAARTVVMKIIS